MELVAYTDSDYAGATLDRKSTTGGCQFLGNRLISWQCKKQTVVATSTTEAEYVAAANCCGQVLWIQNQLLDYGYNFMSTIIYIDNTNPAISLVYDVSTAAATLVYIRRSASKAKDKGKAIIQESEPPKKLKKRVQVQRSVNEELAKRIDLTLLLKFINLMRLEEQWSMYLNESKAAIQAQKKNEDAAANYEQEKADLRLWLKIAQDDEESVNPEILSTKYPIVDWEYQLL
ncbi:hypothetical protein Tco_1580702, partial [Tanacetum coccineum]